MSGLSIDDPIPLYAAINSGNVIPGDTLVLRGGTYSADYVFSLEGTTEEPITIQPYQNERVIIGGDVTGNGNNLTFKNIEFAYLGWTTRESQQTGSNPDDIPDKAVDINGPNYKFINCIFHDLRQVGVWTPATNAEMYGCVIYNLGWISDRGHGHALYTQNALNAVTRKTIRHCVMFNCFGYNLHIYGSDGAMSHYTITENTMFNAGILVDGINHAWYGIMIGAGQSATDNIMDANMTYNNEYGFLSFGEGGDHYQATDNYFPDGWVLTSPEGEATFDVNTGNYTGPAVGNQVFLYANDYDANRANVTIYNQAQANTVDVDVSGVFGASGTVKAYNVQDYFNDVQTLTITAGVITVNMQAANRTVAAPVGWIAPATTFPAFGCFVLVKQ